MVELMKRRSFLGGLGAVMAGLGLAPRSGQSVKVKMVAVAPSGAKRVLAERTYRVQTMHLEAGDALARGDFVAVNSGGYAMPLWSLPGAIPIGVSAKSTKRGQMATVIQAMTYR